jgi:hypothetical protein
VQLRSGGCKIESNSGDLTVADVAMRGPNPEMICASRELNRQQGQLALWIVWSFVM